MEFDMATTIICSVCACVDCPIHNKKICRAIYFCGYSYRYFDANIDLLQTTLCEWVDSFGDSFNGKLKSDLDIQLRMLGYTEQEFLDAIGYDRRMEWI